MIIDHALQFFFNSIMPENFLFSLFSSVFIITLVFVVYKITT